MRAQFANGSVISKKARLAISLLSALVFLGLVFLLCWLCRAIRIVYDQKAITLHCLLIMFFMTAWRQRKYMFFMEDRTDLDDQSKINSELQFFDLTTVVAATDNFSVANKLGKGGFGTVYKALAKDNILITYNLLLCEARVNETMP
ncbi:hypothetical protein DVH24_030772 [Malus domestica]|uniref:Protein kinase domain-containing protein n=1 Tax=Malus domestica TaxID=3750 RepID=A0A498HBN1_MALDO|nr:hypothetical protein DVH24_030772 [Malus domestica]